MGRTKIEWVKNEDGTQGFTVNPVKGLCPVACSYCYARRMYKRFKWNPRIEWDEQCLLDLRKIKQPSRIFVGSIMELFGDFIHPDAIGQILGYCKAYPQHTFIFLTKQPENLIKWSPFPPNVWVGASATNWEMAFNALWEFQDIRAKIKFISFEPLLDWTNRRELEGWLIRSSISWVILGQQTPVKKVTMPEIGWVEEIVNAADKAGIPVFLKDNLISCVDQYEFALKDGKYRQEFPKVSL